MNLWATLYAVCFRFRCIFQLSLLMASMNYLCKLNVHGTVARCETLLCRVQFLLFFFGFSSANCWNVNSVSSLLCDALFSFRLLVHLLHLSVAVSVVIISIDGESQPISLDFWSIKNRKCTLTIRKTQSQSKQIQLQKVICNVSINEILSHWWLWFMKKRE